MNCRRLVLLAACPIVLVHIGEQAHATGPTLKHTTATATILPSATTPDVHDTGKPKSSREPGGLQSVMQKFVDENGLITSSANINRRVIVIVDLP